MLKARSDALRNTAVLTQRPCGMFRSSSANTEPFPDGAFLRWIADLLRGDLKQSQYGCIITLRPKECVLVPTKPRPSPT